MYFSAFQVYNLVAMKAFYMIMVKTETKEKIVKLRKKARPPMSLKY
jgi:hypothetical protein